MPYNVYREGVDSVSIEVASTGKTIKRYEWVDVLKLPVRDRANHALPALRTTRIFRPGRLKCSRVSGSLILTASASRESAYQGLPRRPFADFAIVVINFGTQGSGSEQRTWSVLCSYNVVSPHQ